jgi:predicted nucleic acid-binding protein
MIVVDASVLVDLLLVAADIEKLLDRLRRVETTLHAPEVVDLEVVQAVRRHERTGIWRGRGNLNAYDAAYVVLAEGLDATLLTRDARLAAAPGQRVRIEIV